MDQRLDQQAAPAASPTAPPGDVVENALAAALAQASAAGEWGVVAQLARELEARRMARAGAKPADVINLDERRRGR